MQARQEMQVTNANPPKSPPRPSFGNTVPAGETHEFGDETGWAAWHEAVDKANRQYHHTTPMTAPAPADGGDPRYAKTVAAPLSTERGSLPVPGAALRADVVMVEARRNNRMCPRQQRWAELVRLFGQWSPAAKDLPPPPFAGDAWLRTSALTKRIAFRDHVEWAEQHGCLPQLLAFLQGLQEQDWQHMGD